MVNRKRVLSAVAVGGVAVVLAGALQSAVADPWTSSPTDWSPNATEVGQVTQRLLALATSSEGTGETQARTAGAWPANVTAVRVFGTNRPSALKGMKSAEAAPAEDVRPVVCAEARGEFTTANVPKPRGAPIVTYRYAATCVDAVTGEVLDVGYDNDPMGIPAEPQPERRPDQAGGRLISGRGRRSRPRRRTWAA